MRFLGKRLSLKLAKKHFVTATTTKNSPDIKIHFQILNPQLYRKIPRLVQENDLIIVTASGTKTGYLTSYLVLARKIKKALQHSEKKTLIYTSSTGVYQDQPIVLENSPLDYQNSSLLIQTENTYLSIPRHRVVILRLSGLFGYERSLERIYSIYKDRPMKPKYSNFVHVDQVIEAIDYMIHFPLRGIFNVSSLHFLNKDMFEALFKKMPLIENDQVPPCGKKVLCDKLFKLPHFRWTEVVI